VKNDGNGRPRRAAADAAARRRKPARARLQVDERRRQLVELGLARFSVSSYEEVSIDEIAVAAGIAKGLLYHYFPTKRAFYAACVEEAADRMLAACTDAATGVPPLERLDRGVAAYLAYVEEHGPGYASLMRSGVGDRALASIVDDTRAKLVDLLLEGLAETVPMTPLRRIALLGWVGFAETSALAWAEERVRAAHEGRSPISAKRIEALLKTALFAVVGEAPT